MARSESSDFIRWSEPRLIVEPEPDDPPQTQTYGLQGFPYGPYTLGQIAVFNTSEKDMRWIHPDGTKDVQLGHSRGGWCWHRTVRDRRFIALGDPGAWDSQQVTPSTSPVLLKDRLVFYYNGAPFRHGGGYTWADECVGLAELRADGFVSLDTSEGEGEIVTRAFALRKGDIFLNADAKDGEVRVEVLTDTGTTIPGFEMSACQPLQGDSIEHRVRWRSGPDPARIERIPIRLRGHGPQGQALFALDAQRGCRHPLCRIPGDSVRGTTCRSGNLIPPGSKRRSHSTSSMACGFGIRPCRAFR